MVTFKGGCDKLYYTQHTLLSNVGQLPILFFLFWRNKHTHTREREMSFNTKAHILNVFSLIFEVIHIGSLITTIKNNKIVFFIFNMRLNIFTNFLFFILTPTFLRLYCHINSF